MAASPQTLQAGQFDSPPLIPMTAPILHARRRGKTPTGKSGGAGVLRGDCFGLDLSRATAEGLGYWFTAFLTWGLTWGLTLICVTFWASFCIDSRAF